MIELSAGDRYRMMVSMRQADVGGIESGRGQKLLSTIVGLWCVPQLIFDIPGKFFCQPLCGSITQGSNA